MSGNVDSYSHVGFQVGSDWRVTCHTYDDTMPILSIDAGKSAVSITTRSKETTTAAVEFARTLVREVQRFADELERMYSDNTKATDSDAA